MHNEDPAEALSDLKLFFLLATAEFGWLKKLYEEQLHEQYRQL